MFKKIMMTVVLFSLIATNAHAHIMNRDNLYSDLYVTEAADDIVLLAALHVIQADSPQFDPANTLTMAQLATWVAGYYSLADAQAALDAGFVQTLDGNATYEAVNKAYFNGALTLSAEQQGELTREEFAQFVARHVNNAVNGQTMIEAASFTAGPTGVVEEARVENGQNIITVSGQDYVLGNHPSAIATTTDPAVWVGQSIAESYFGPNGERDFDKASDDTALQFIVLGEKRYTELPVETQQQTTIEQALEEVEVVAAQPEAEQTSWTWLYVTAACIVAALLFVFSNKKRA